MDVEGMRITACIGGKEQDDGGCRLAWLALLFLLIGILGIRLYNTINNIFYDFIIQTPAYTYHSPSRSTLSLVLVT